jgi:hypothetical protein
VKTIGVSVDNQDGVKEPLAVIRVDSATDMLVKKVGKAGIVYLPVDWADAEVIVVRRRKV